MRRKRTNYSPKEKVAILKRHLVDQLAGIFLVFLRGNSPS